MTERIYAREFVAIVLKDELLGVAKEVSLRLMMKIEIGLERYIIVIAYRSERERNRREFWKFFKGVFQNLKELERIMMENVNVRVEDYQGWSNKCRLSGRSNENGESNYWMSAKKDH